VATNPTLEGEMTASHLARLVKTRGVKASRIAGESPSAARWNSTTPSPWPSRLKDGSLWSEFKPF